MSNFIAIILLPFIIIPAFYGAYKDAERKYNERYRR